MIDTKQYLEVLIEGLKKKNRLLSQVKELNDQQAQVIRKNDTLDQFDEIVTKKQVLIDEINKVDNGFQSVYDRVRKDVEENKKQYKEQISKLQELIHQATDLGIEIQAGEARNKSEIEQYFSYLHKGIHSSKRSLKAANDYYKNMNGLSFNENSIWDQKK